MGSTRALLAIALLGLAADASAQIVREMTPELIEKAINDKKAKACYTLVKQGGLQGAGTPLGCFSTPYSRVAGASADARKKYQAFAATDVTPEMVAAEIQVYGWAVRPWGKAVWKPQSPTAVYDVEAIVLMPDGSKDPAKAVHPSRTSEIPLEFKNLMGAVLEGKGMLAAFPISKTRDMEVRFVYDGIKEESVPFHLDQVK